jgi:ATP-dependent DNA ligase
MGLQLHRVRRVKLARDPRITHIGDLQDASWRQPERLAYFAFDLLHLDGRLARRPD